MPEANFEQVDIAARLNSVVKLFSNNNEQIKISYQGKDAGVYVYADPKQMVQVFNNLLKNAIQSIPTTRTGKINISLEEINNQVVINFTDNGIGISSDVQDKIFNPNFTTKSTGMGLGLAISKNIIELSGGIITFSSKINKGTSFKIFLTLAT
jgi:signal transduction histidine kinase